MTFTKACCAPGDLAFTQPESSRTCLLHGSCTNHLCTPHVDVLCAGVEWEGTPQGRVRKIAAFDGWLSVYLQEPKGTPSSAVILISGAQACVGALLGCVDALPCICLPDLL